MNIKAEAFKRYFQNEQLKAIKKEENIKNNKRLNRKLLLKDLLNFIGLAFLCYITYNLLLLSAYLIN